MKNNNYINIILISGSGLISGIINYIYHPVMLRFLSLEEFGEFASLMGIFNILGIFLLGITLFLNKETSKNKDSKGKIKYLFLGSAKILLLFGFLIYLIYIILSPLIGNFLQIPLPLILIAGFSIVISSLGTASDSVLRGIQAFRFIAGVSIIGAMLKLSIGFIGVYLGRRIYGALSGVIISGICSLIIGYAFIYHTYRGVPVEGSFSQFKKDFLSQGQDIFQFVTVSFFFAFFMNADILLAKNIFPSVTVGTYAGISVLGKFLVFLLMSIETVYYSQIMEIPKKKVQKHLIRNPIILIVITSSLAIVFNIFFGNFILATLKPELQGNLGIYLLVLFSSSLVSLTSFLSKILIGWKIYKANLVSLLSSLLLILSIYSFGRQSLYTFILLFIVNLLLQCIVFIFMLVKEMGKQQPDLT